MAIEVFNRYEKKYMLDKEQYEAVINKMSSHMEVDAYNKDNKFYMISNIYYDTPDDRLIRASIEKPAYKEKMRVRSYGVPGIDDNVFVEIKKKYNGIVNKRRTGIKLGDAYDYLDGKITAGMLEKKNERINRQVLGEIDYFKHFIICSLNCIFHMKEWHILKKMTVVSGLHLILILQQEGMM